MNDIETIYTQYEDIVAEFSDSKTSPIPRYSTRNMPMGNRAAGLLAGFFSL